MKTRRTLTSVQFVIEACILLSVTVTAFVCSEVFQNYDLVLYPSVLILIIGCLFFPCMLSVTFPEEWLDPDTPLRRVLFVFIYPLFWIAARTLGWAVVKVIVKIF